MLLVCSEGAELWQWLVSLDSEGDYPCLGSCRFNILSVILVCKSDCCSIDRKNICRWMRDGRGVFAQESHGSYLEWSCVPIDRTSSTLKIPDCKNKARMISPTIAWCLGVAAKLQAGRMKSAVMSCYWFLTGHFTLASFALFLQEMI